LCSQQVLTKIRGISTLFLKRGGILLQGVFETTSPRRDQRRWLCFRKRAKRVRSPLCNRSITLTDLTLKQVVAAAVDHLYGPKGFFIMAEGGKIDWAGHSKDARTNILEVLDFADAVEVACRFYQKSTLTKP
jgi:alkaline phosphatase